MESLLQRTKAQPVLNELIAKAHPQLAEMIEVQRPKTQETVINMLNSNLLKEGGSELKQELNESDPEIQKLLAQAYIDSANGYRSNAVDFLNAVRRTTVDIGMWATPGWFQFFDFVQLKNDERPQVRQDFENEFEVIVLGQEMGVESRRYVRENLSYRDINMVFRSTPEIAYTLLNPDTGAYQLNRPTMSELERAHSYNLNEMCGDAIGAALGVFPTALGGSSFLLHNADLNHSSFKNVPSTNDINLDSEGAITKEIFIAIFDYMARMPGFGTGNDFRSIRTIHIPSVDAKQLWRFVSVTSAFTSPPDVLPGATFSPEFQAQLERSGFPSQMFGIPFTIVIDKTLPANYLYISFDQAAGTVWEKPGMTQFVDRVEPELNRGVVKQLKVYQVTVEPHQRPNVLRVKYNT